MANKKGTLHALIANVAASKGQTEQILGESQKTFKSAHLFDALSRTYRPTHEDEKPQPAEHTVLTTTVGEKLNYMAKMVAPTIDILFQVDKTNMGATGDIEIDGLEIKDVPVTFLMQFDKYITKIRNVVMAIPTLNKDYRWQPSNEGAGVWETPVMEKVRTRKILQHKVLYEATKEHRAEIEKWSEDMPVGMWEEVVTTGRITSAEKHEILSRVDALQKAARKAIAQANTTEHNTEKVGRKIFNYLIGNIPVKRG